MSDSARSRTGARSPTRAVGARSRSHHLAPPGRPAPPGCSQRSTGADHAASVAARGSRRHGGRPARQGDRAVVVPQAARPLQRPRSSRVPTSRTACAWQPRRSGRPTSSSVRSSRRAKGCFPPSWSTSSRSAATRCPPSRSRPFVLTVEQDLGCRLEDVFEYFDRDAAGRRLDRPGARRPAAHRRGRRRQGAAPVGRRAWSTRTSG